MKTERVLVCGGRDYNNRLRFTEVMDKLSNSFHIECVITGMARGADTLGLTWAQKNGIPTLEFHPDWAIYGRGAGFVRNQRMLDEGRPTLVVAFPGGRGTADMVRRARKSKVSVIEVLEKAVSFTHRLPELTTGE